MDDALTPTDDTAVVWEDSTDNVIDVLANDHAVDAEDHLVTVGQAPNGRVALDAVTHQVTYTPMADYFGRDVFNYVVSDGATNWVVTVWVTVENVNDAPEAGEQVIGGYEDIPTSVELFTYDADGETLSYTIDSGPSHGTLSGTAPHLTYTPAADYFGSDAFSYTVADAADCTAAGYVALEIEELNDPPKAYNDSVIVSEDSSSVIVYVLDNDADSPDTGETLSVTEVTGGYGTAELIAGAVYYTPPADYFGEDVFEYTLSDGRGGTSVGIVYVSVSNVNDAPVAVDDGVELLADQVTDFDVLANDTDVDGDALSISAVTTPQHGQAAVVTVDDVDLIRYTPAAHYFGTDSFSYTVSDGHGGTDTAEVRVTVLAWAEPPDAVDDAASVNEDARAELDVLSNDWPEAATPDVLRVIAVTAPSHGTATILHRVDQRDVVSYQPAADYFGSDCFAYTIANRRGQTDTATVTITVTSVNDPPVAEEFYVETLVGIACRRFPC